MDIYITGPINNNNCLCRKNKTSGINLQCPHKKKNGDYCGKHSNENKWRLRIDDSLTNTNLKVLIKEEDFLKDVSLKNFNVKSIKFSCKKYNLIKSKDNNILLNNLQSFFKNIIKYKKYEFQIKLLQRNIKVYLKNKKKILRGPAIFKRELCNNNEDFLSFESVHSIPFEDFISFKDDDNFIYGFDINSFEKLIENKMSNPYNRKPIPLLAIKNLKSILKMITVKKDNELSHLTTKQKLKHRVLKIFQEIDTLGVYAGGTDISWFMDLTPERIKSYYKLLEDIWNYRANLTNTQKARIVPYQNMFPYSVSNFNKINNINKMSDILLTEMEKLVFTAELDSDRALGCYYILIAFVEINPLVAQLMPWLVQY